MFLLSFDCFLRSSDPEYQIFRSEIGSGIQNTISRALSKQLIWEGGAVFDFFRLLVMRPYIVEPDCVSCSIYEAVTPIKRSLTK